MKIHLCCGGIYLKDYINCDIDGILLELAGSNSNETTLDKYFKYPFEQNAALRTRPRFILDLKMNILERWPFAAKSADEIVMVSAFEHFEHRDEIPHIISEACRVLKPDGVFKFDFPDIKAQVDQYYGKDDEFLMELIYCNHKNKHSMHLWGYTPQTLPSYLNPNVWQLEFKDVVKHDYPMTGCWATKKGYF